MQFLEGWGSVDLFPESQEQKLPSVNGTCMHAAAHGPNSHYAGKTKCHNSLSLGFFYSSVHAKPTSLPR